MWKKLYEAVWKVLRLADDAQKHGMEIKDLWKRTGDLTDAVQRIAFEMQRISEHEKHEREILELRLRHESERHRHEREKLEMQLEIERLRTERGLPPATPKDKEENSDSVGDLEQ